jgi:hypothetical protein
MKLTREHFDAAIGALATKDYVDAKVGEVLFRLSEAMADIEEGLGAEERLALIERKLDRLQQVLHVEV